MEKTASEILQMDPDDVSKLSLIEQMIYWQHKHHHAWVAVMGEINSTRTTTEEQEAINKALERTIKKEPTRPNRK